MTDPDFARRLRLCVGCGQPLDEHIGPTAPPLTPGHLGHEGKREAAKCLLTGGRIYDNKTRREITGRGYPSSGHSAGAGIPIHGNEYLHG